MTATRACSTPAGTRGAACAGSRRGGRSSPIRRPRRGSPCPSSSCSRATATGASAFSLELSGRVAIVTGGASGAGWSIVRRLVDEGVAVVIADVADSAGEGAVAGNVERGGRGIFVRTDVRVDGDVEHM